MEREIRNGLSIHQMVSSTKQLITTKRTQRLNDMIVLDGRNMLTKASLHSEIKEKMEFPDYYGGNLDALWDCLTSWIDLPVEIEWRYFNLVNASLGEYAKKVVMQFQEADDVMIEFREFPET